jgi:N-acetylgalactosamine-6-sulfatase
MIPDSPLPSEYGYDSYGAFNCAGEQMPVHEDAQNAVAFIEQSHTEKRPFFINLWIHEPHTPFHTVPKYRWRFKDLPEKDNIYASVLSHADDRIGQVLDKLDELGIADNTLVIFSSDNGPARASQPGKLGLFHDTATGSGYGINAAKGVTGGRKGYKGALFEGGIGVPFLVRWPGKVAVGAIDETSLISAVDLLPTFCQIAGADLPKDYKPDGLSQVDVLMGKAKTKRQKPLYWKINAAWPADKKKPHHWVSYVVVDQQWKLVANRDGSYVELYNIAVDPYEKNDMKKGHAEVVATLQKKLAVWKSELPSKPDESCFSKHRK